MYEKHCSACHGAQGKGDEPAGQALKPPAADLTSSKVKGAADAELLHTVQNRKTVDRHDSF